MNRFFRDGGFYTKNNLLNLTPAESYRWCVEQGAVMVDVREEYMNRFKMFNVPEVIYCPMTVLPESFRELPVDKPLIFADAAGLRSKDAVEFLLVKGFDNIANMAGGLVEWERDKLPLMIDKTNRLSGSCMCQLRFREKK